jgi:uracil phosphoribosyltransferase
MATTHVVTHPLVQHKLTLMRQKERSTSSFRRLLHEIGMLMAYEVTREMPTQTIEIETPLASMQAPVIDGKKTVFVVVMRAGSGLLDGMLEVVPGARVGHIGLYRDPKSLVAVEYYFKMPAEMHERDAIVLDPMLATGHSSVAAVGAVKEAGVKRLIVVGGAGSLEVAPGLQLIDTPQFPDAYRPEASAGRDFLNALRAETSLDWTFLSPSALFEPGERTGKFRLGGDQLLADAAGQSRISMEDYAIALVDEIETPKHVRQRFTVGY